MRLIDADAVYELHSNYPAFARSYADLTDLRDILEDAPTIDAVPVVHGRWIHTDMAAWWFGKDECSECQYHDDERNDLSRLKYCPNCGAKMDGGETDEP